ncbi:MAG: tetratricopeptide repeat protein [Harvfovirus sp.]|uniref:Tetratricopeptide repeat protein n=1 Tax=Harvfovirus sp. TaxID=2487768 RepID=A0A3G5A1C9_9VIRU|nr:MAG: tetratricopeptide repeat protein [Harvfovirus sp.]
MQETNYLKMGAKSSTPVLAINKIIGEIIEKKESLIESVELKNALLALTDDERKHLALVHHDDNPAVMVVIGAIYENLKNDEYACQLYEIAVKANHPKAYYKSGLLKYRVGKMEDGFALITKAAELKDIEGLIWMGRFCKGQLNLPQWDKAEKYFLDALEIDPTNKDAANELLDLYSNNLPHERQYIKKVFQKTSEAITFGKIYNILGEIYYMKDDLAKSFEYFKRALKFVPERYDAMFGIAIYHRAGAGFSSEEYLFEAARNSHMKSIIYLSRAYRNGTSGIDPSPENAHYFNTQALKLNDPTLMCEIAYYYRMKNMFLHSLKILSQAKDLTTDHDTEDIDREISEIMATHTDSIISQLRVINLEEQLTL